MKFFISVLLTALLAFAAGLYLPWWSLALAAFSIALCIPQRAGISFLSGFSGVFLMWGIVAWLRDHANEQILSQKIANLFGLNGSSFLLILIVAITGGLVAGFSALAAAYLRKPIRR